MDRWVGDEVGRWKGEDMGFYKLLNKIIIQSEFMNN